MKINTLGFWKNVTTWGGSIIAVSGLCYGASLGKFDIVSGSIAGSGIAINAIGILIGMAQSRQQQAEKEALKKRLKDMDRRIREARDKPATYA
ncbi:hypothetical protein HZ994_09395 [Akkermansiaceae bacterium]|nr:hypothetical protein HZ994_09395 [Akkermansiaceae bacterium]